MAAVSCGGCASRCHRRTSSITAEKMAPVISRTIKSRQSNRRFAMCFSSLLSPSCLFRKSARAARITAAASSSRPASPAAVWNPSHTSLCGRFAPGIGSVMHPPTAHQYRSTAMRDREDHPCSWNIEYSGRDRRMQRRKAPDRIEPRFGGRRRRDFRRLSEAKSAHAATCHGRRGGLSCARMPCDNRATSRDTRDSMGQEACRFELRERLVTL